MSDIKASYSNLQSTIEPSFWSELTQRKLNQFKLSEDPVAIFGRYGCSSTRGRNDVLVSSTLHLDGQAFNEQQQITKGSVVVRGSLVLLNTMERFRELDKKQVLLDELHRSLTYTQPHTIGYHSFLLLCFADLKKFHYTYWVGFPSLRFARNLTVKRLELRDFQKVAGSCEEWRQNQQKGSEPFWWTNISQNGVTNSNFTSNAFTTTPQTHLSVIDPSSSSEQLPWTLRNLALQLYKTGISDVQVICWRENKGQLDSQQSRVFAFTPQLENGQRSFGVDDVDNNSWEARPDGKGGQIRAPKFVNLKSSMDPLQLAEDAVGLNLKLMRWRAAPDLEVDRLQGIRCLLLGAGTLGCAVARCLQAWGVRTITFLDNSHVAYANPVRQWLYLHEDSRSAPPKAEAAAERLKEVFPGTNSKGVNLSIPMPGHPPPPSELENCKQQYEQLKQLILDHDVVFLLMDSRESRWLPTMLCTTYNVPCLNTALGFSSFVIVRHGHGALTQDDTQQERLGCYFCQDVVAPTNSQTNRTLDQQCTVARPGLSPMAASLTVELMATMMQHPLQQAAPPDSDDTALGSLPHMIRGELSTWEVRRMNFPAYPQCTACSRIVAEHEMKEGWDFVLRAICQNDYLEEMTGLAEWKRKLEDNLNNQATSSAAEETVCSEEDEEDWAEI